MLDTRREKIVVGGGTAAIALLLYVLTSGSEPPPEPAAAPAPQAAAARPAPLAPPPPPAPAATSAQAPEPAAAPGAGLTLHGVLGGGRTGSAIIGGPDGDQRLVLAGREAAPGLVLRDIGADRVVLSGASGDIVLRLGGQSLAGADGAAGALSAPGSSIPRTLAQQRTEARRFRLGLAPRRAGGRITGYAIRPEASLPLLQRAGLRPGDVLVSVNGQSFDSDEQVLDLPGEIAGSYTAEFEFERNGRRMRASLPVTSR